MQGSNSNLNPECNEFHYDIDKLTEGVGVGEGGKQKPERELFNSV